MTLRRRSGSRDLAPQFGARHPLERLHRDRCLGEPDDLRLAHRVDAEAGEALHARDVLEREALRRGVGAVDAGEHPRRRSLVDVEMCDPRCDGGDDLDRRCAGADHRDPLGVQVGVVIPARGVEDLAGEILDPGDVGQRGLAQRADRGDHDVGGVRTLVGFDLPHRPLGVPPRAGDLTPEAVLVAHVEAGGDGLDVALDLRLGGERAGPGRVEGERVRVQLGGDVAGGAGVGVVAPGTTDFRAAFEHDEIRLAPLAQPDRRAEAGEPAADDQDVDVVRARLGR